jgi:hypothetical protein
MVIWSIILSLCKIVCTVGGNAIWLNPSSLEETILHVPLTGYITTHIQNYKITNNLYLWISVTDFSTHINKKQHWAHYFQTNKQEITKNLSIGDTSNLNIAIDSWKSALSYHLYFTRESFFINFVPIFEVGNHKGNWYTASHLIEHTDFMCHLLTVKKIVWLNSRSLVLFCHLYVCQPYKCYQ